MHGGVYDRVHAGNIELWKIEAHVHICQQSSALLNQQIKFITIFQFDRCIRFVKDF